MKKILIGITLSQIGGGQKVVYDLVANLPEEGYDITLVTAPGGELIHWINRLNATRNRKIKVMPLTTLKRNISPINDLRCFFELWRIMRKHRFDIAHFHSSKMGILGRMVARIAKVPRIYYTVHGWCMNKETTGALYGAMCALERWAAKVSTGVVFVSKHDQQMGIEHHWVRPQQSYVIPNGINESSQLSVGLRSQIGASQEDVVVAFTARLAQPKEPLLAIKVVERLAKEGLPIKLVIIGDGALRLPCESYICEHVLENVVTMMGKREDVRALLQEADIFMLLSKWEGLPISILEAMDAGLPVVASRVGGIPELIKEAVSGYLVGSDVESVAKCLTPLVQDTQLRLRLGQAGQKTVKESFNLDRMLERYLDLYAG